MWTALERSHAWFWGMWNVQLVDWIRRITVLVDCWGGLPWRGRKRDLGVNRSVVDIRLLKPKSEWPQTQVKSSIVILPAPRVDTNENRLVSSVLVFRKDVMKQSVLILLCTLASCEIWVFYTSLRGSKCCYRKTSTSGNSEIGEKNKRMSSFHR